MIISIGFERGTVLNARTEELPTSPVVQWPRGHCSTGRKAHHAKQLKAMDLKSIICTRSAKLSRLSFENGRKVRLIGFFRFSSSYFLPLVPKIEGICKKRVDASPHDQIFDPFRLKF